MKAVVAIIIGVLLFGGGLAGGLILQGSLMNNHQPITTMNEQLAVEGYVSRPFTIFGIQFSLKNEGSTNLQIVNIMINGFLNQSSSDSMIGWNGTTFFYPNQTGLISVYYPAYSQAIKTMIPSISSQPTLEDLESLESWMNSFNSTFTFITSTAHSYNYTIPRLGYDIFTALSLSQSQSQSTFDFMATEQLIITNLQFGTAATMMNVTMLNTGTNTVTITEIHVNNGANLISTITPVWNGVIAGNSNVTTTFTFAWVNGAQYEVELKSGKGNEFTYTATAPS